MEGPHPPLRLPFLAPRTGGRPLLLTWLPLPWPRAWPMRDQVLLTLGLATLTGPPLLDLLVNGWKRVFWYFAADTFYYLTVARNLALHGSLSFDQERTTNGFHPLWQFLTGLLYKLTSLLGLPDSAFLVLVFLTGLALLGLALVVLASCFRLALGRVPSAFPLLPVGLYALATWPIDPQYGSLWSYANGMESALAVLAFAWVLRSMLLRETSERLVTSLQLSIALSVLMLSRLDHGLLAVCIFIVFFFRALPIDRLRVRRFLALTVPFMSVLGLYVTFNWLTAGSLLPVSASIKSTFPDPVGRNVIHLGVLILFPDAPQALPWRQAQVFLPAAVAGASLLFLLTQWRCQRHDLLTVPLSICSAFVVGLAAYNFLFVPLWHQGHWYFPVSVLLTTILPLYFWERYKPVARRTRTAEVVLAGGGVALVALFFSALYHDPNYNARYQTMFESRSEIRAHFGSDQPRIIEYDDGIVAFTTGYPTMSGLGFALDSEAVAWMERAPLLWLAYDRGFDHIASVNYFDSGGLSEDSSSEEIRERLSETFFLRWPDIQPFDFRVAYVTPGEELAIIAMELRECPSSHLLRGCPGASELSGSH